MNAKFNFGYFNQAIYMFINYTHLVLFSLFRKLYCCFMFWFLTCVRSHFLRLRELHCLHSISYSYTLPWPHFIFTIIKNLIKDDSYVCLPSISIFQIKLGLTLFKFLKSFKINNSNDVCIKSVFGMCRTCWSSGSYYRTSNL